MATVFWFRRDLRLQDNPALNLAITNAADHKVTAMVMIDDALWPTWGAAKQHYLVDSLSRLNKSIDENLVVRHGDPIEEVVKVALAAEATEVHCGFDYTTVGINRDAAVKSELAKHGIELIQTGSIYAVSPGRVSKPDGTPYKVYTPFYKAWLKHGWRGPVEYAGHPNWQIPIESMGFPNTKPVEGMELSTAGEAEAHRRFAEFKATHLRDYTDARDRADLDGTSKLSVHLKWGEIHPRTLLAQLGDEAGHETYRKELAWREFYADVLFHNPHTISDYLNPEFANMEYNKGPVADLQFAAWKAGQTGYPMVDAGMRQLLQEGWMHNRVRMITASFLIKDLHLEWQQGAAWFFELLKDADLASNQHGWQWTAGCGTDASPYYRVFNPIEQGKKFDPEGTYIRKYVPELRHLDNDQIHEPWLYLDGYSQGYVERIVDHAKERIESLARLEEIKQGS